MRFASFSALVLLAACATAPVREAQPGPASAETLNPMDMQIAIGRWGVMMSEVHDLVAAREGAVEPAGDPSAAPALARDLRETVWAYNLERSQLCARGQMMEASCGPAYAPAWLSEAPSASPDLAELERRSAAVGDVVMPFWDAVCESARAKVAQDERMAVCPME